ncbi:MAG: hypothetical protein K2X74_23850, partial [Acetobacteraceae bacterium]|nr:hypothetical protein [Acetobacteraceae bacterium]
MTKTKPLSPEEQKKADEEAAAKAEEEFEEKQERARKADKKQALAQTRQQIAGADRALEAIAEAIATSSELSVVDRSWGFCVNLGQPTYNDLVSDLGCENSTPTIIDGDSLLFDVLCDRSIDWAHGGQCAHVIYLVKAFLSQWAQLGMSASVIFFEKPRALWAAKPQAQLLRQLIISHLNSDPDLAGILANRSEPIPAVWSDEFREHVFIQQPNCFIVSDGFRPDDLPHKAEGRGLNDPLRFAPLPQEDLARLTFSGA